MDNRNIQKALRRLLAQIEKGGEQVGEWLLVEQERIDRFAEVTGDHQWIHLDHERAKRESPYSGTVAHGYLNSLPAHRHDGGLPKGGAPLRRA